MPALLLAALLLVPAPGLSGQERAGGGRRTERGAEVDPRALGGQRYDAAVAEVERSWAVWRRAFTDYGVPAEEIVAAVFPELLRFSGLRNDLEVFSLKVLYVSQGASYADFSIGPFQMKPSFAERLEAQVLLWESAAPELYGKWRRLLPPPEAAAPREARRLRVERLSEMEWQLAYAACFYDAVAERGLLAGADGEERLFLLSTAYNAGFGLDREELLARASVPRYSPDPFGAGRYHYQDVASYFAEHDLSRIAGREIDTASMEPASYR
jgi:hypothetical protein